MKKIYIQDIEKLNKKVLKILCTGHGQILAFLNFTGGEQKW